MNKLIIMVVFFFLIFQDLAAQSIDIGFNSTHSGRNITAQYELLKGKNEFSFGLGININKLAQNDDQNNFYKKRLFATEVAHYLNLNFTYQRYILSNKIRNIEPFVFYDLQAKYSTTRSRLILPHAFDSTLVVNKPEQGILYRETIENFGPFAWLENNIGIGFKAMITERLYIKQRFGVGVDLILGYDDQILYRRFSWFDWEFSTLMQFSVGYKFKKKSS